MSRSDWFRLLFLACCSHCSGGFHSASWRDKCLSVGPPISGTARFWACQCVIKRKAVHGNQPYWQIPRKKTTSWNSLLNFSALFYFSVECAKPRKTSRSLSKVNHLLVFYLVQPQFVSLLLNSISLARKYCLIFVDTGRVCSSSGKLGFNEKWVLGRNWYIFLCFTC